MSYGNLKNYGYYGRDWEEHVPSSPYYGNGRPINDPPYIPEKMESDERDSKIIKPKKENQ